MMQFNLSIAVGMDSFSGKTAFEYETIGSTLFQPLVEKYCKEVLEVDVEARYHSYVQDMELLSILFNVSVLMTDEDWTMVQMSKDKNGLGVHIFNGFYSYADIATRNINYMNWWINSDASNARFNIVKSWRALGEAYSN